MERKENTANITKLRFINQCAGIRGITQVMASTNNLAK